MSIIQLLGDLQVETATDDQHEFTKHVHECSWPGLARDLLEAACGSEQRRVPLRDELLLAAPLRAADLEGRDDHTYGEALAIVREAGC